jgi:hypothetical protein
MLFPSNKVLLTCDSVVDPDPDPAFSNESGSRGFDDQILKKIQLEKIIFFDQNCYLLMPGPP